MMDIFRKYGAKAIWADEKEMVNRHVKFQTELVVDEIRPTKFYICSETRYELYINGNLAGFGQYDDFPDNKVYDTCDITEFLKKGSNLVSILAYSVGTNMPSMHLKGLSMLIFAAVDENGTVLISDENVKCAEAKEFVSGDKIERICSERMFNFGFDLRNDDLWKENKVSDSWQNAIVRDDSAINYCERSVKELTLTGKSYGEIIAQGEFEYTKGDTVAQKMQYSSMAHRDKAEVLDIKEDACGILKDNVYWISDLGEEVVGFITLDIEAEDGAVLDIGIGEHLADMRVRTYVGERNYAFRCICREGRQKISFYIQRLALRYLQFFAHSGIKKVYSAGIHKTEYPLEFEGQLSMSDRLFNKIYKVSENTLKCCMHDHYEDCPEREQSLYAMDSRNQMLFGYYAFGETKMPRASLKLLADGQLPSGLLEITAPSRCRFTIPAFSLAWIMAVKEYVMFSGDKDFGISMVKTARTILDYFVRNMKDGLIPHSNESEIWNFYEWTDKMDNLEVDSGSEFDAPINAFFALGLKEYKQLCEWADAKEEIKWADEVYNKVSSVFHKTFYCEDKQAYRTYIGSGEPHFAQLTQAWALLSGLVPDELNSKIREHLTSKDFVEISLSYSGFKYDALMQEPEKYSDYVLSDIEEQWGYMLYNGATTFWETILGEADFDGAGSLCHGWSAVPIYIFWRYIVGIYPKAPGFIEIENNPVCKGVVRAEGVLKTPQGILNIKTDGKVTTISKGDI